MKRILYVDGCRDGTVGGSHTSLYSIVTNLNRQRYQPVTAFYNDHFISEKLRGKGIDAHIISMCNPIVGFPFYNNSFFQSTANFIFTPFRKSFNFFWYFLRSATIYAWRLKKWKINILHLNNSLSTNHEWMLAAKLAGVKVLTHQRGISDVPTRTEMFFGKRLDAVICISKALCLEMERRGISADKLKLIYDGIDVLNMAVSSDPAVIRKTYCIRSNSFVIGVIGNIKEWKGQETVIRAIAILKANWTDIKCLLVGEAVQGDSYKTKLDEIIRELEISKNVIFTGYQKNPADYINVMDVVVHSSIEPEPFGIVNIEAMYMKKPVISTNIGGPQEIFDNGRTGILIEPGKPELLAEKIITLLKNNELRNEMGQRAHEAVIRKFSISSAVHQIEAAYDELFL